MPTTAIIAGIGTGLLTVLLLASLLGGSGLAVPLFVASPLPMAIAGFMWGPAAAIVAAVTVGIVIIPIGGPIPALGAFLVIAGPMALAIYLFGLSRVAPDGSRLWYPLGEILLRVAAMVGLGLVVVGAVAGYDPASLAAETADLMEAWLADMDMAFTSTDIQSLTELTFAILPVSTAALAVAMFVANIALGARIGEVSGRPLRPRPPLWAVSLPPLAAYAFGGALLLSLVSGSVGDIGSAIAGAFGLALALTGLGVIHAVTLGRPARPLVLTLAYVSIPMLGVPLILFAFLGLVDCFVRIRPPIPPSPST